MLSGQFLAQMRRPVRDAIIGNAGTIVAFQSGLDDADILAPVFEHETIDLLVGLNRGEIATKLIINGQTQPPFIAHTYPDLGEWYGGRRDNIREQSRRRYGRPRAVVEAKLRRWNPPCEEPATPSALIKKAGPAHPKVLVNIQNFYESAAHDEQHYDPHATVLKKIADIRSANP